MSTNVPRFHDSMRHRLMPPPVAPGSAISFYACGITPYSPAHIGHARSFVVFDLMASVLRHAGYNVTVVRNVTDVDDKIINHAALSGVAWDTLSHAFAEQNRAQMKELGVVGYEEPYASTHMGPIIDLIVILQEKGHAYVSSTGDVLFDTGSFSGSVLMAHDPDDHSGPISRVDQTGKRAASDFVLWKTAKTGEPSWPSPWGAGRPGWHIECSAMVHHRFGDTLAYHGGGTDLRFPHHQAEILQSEAAFGRPLAHRWVHHGSVRDGQGRKMSKSLGNVVLLDEALAESDVLLPGFGGWVLRLALLSSLWTKPLDWWGPTVLPQAARHLATFSEAAGIHPPSASRGQTVENALRANLNTPKAFAIMHELAAKALRGDAEAASAVAHGLALLGVPTEVHQTLGKQLGPQAAAEIPQEVALLAQERARLRASHQWAQADAVRATITALGFSVEDTSEGHRISKILLQ